MQMVPKSEAKEIKLPGKQMLQPFFFDNRKQLIVLYIFVIFIYYISSFQIILVRGKCIARELKSYKNRLKLSNEFQTKLMT